jgi:type IV fimbrial biogenesis protein FimT
VCASTDGATCGGDWNDGWLISTDADDVEADFEQVIRYVQGHPRLAIAGSAAPQEIIFDYRGRPDAASAGETITLQPDQCPSGQQLVRVMTINTIGQVNTDREACP